jgi:hypothetical protein
MAINLRLNEADDAVLETLAKSYGLSKQQAVIKAIHEAAARRDHAALVDRVSTQVAHEWRELLDELKTM